MTILQMTGIGPLVVSAYLCGSQIQHTNIDLETKFLTETGHVQLSSGYKMTPHNANLCSGACSS